MDGGSPFEVHRNLICASSAYFKRWVAQGLAHFWIPMHEAVEVSSYIHWLYTGTICTKEKAADRAARTRPEDGVVKEDPEYIDLARLYSLGRTLEDVAFAGVVTDAFIAKQRETRAQPGQALPGSQCINLIFSFHPHTDSMARLLLETYVREGGVGSLDSMRGQVDPRFLQELSSMLLSKRAKPMLGVNDLNKCEFHDHPLGKSCEVEKHSRKRRRIED